MEATIDVEKVYQLESYRVQSEVFDLTSPEDNIYDVRPGLTLSVCDGYWLFIKPLEVGKHNIYFRGEALLKEANILAHLNSREVYRPIRRHINEKSAFKLEASYELTIIKQ